MKRMLFLPLAAACLLVQAEPTNNLMTDCIIQEVLPGKHMTTAFFTLHHSGIAQSIVSAAIPSVTDIVELHRMVRKNGDMVMEKISHYPLQDGETLFFNGPYHLMLMQIKHPPAIGSKHYITLFFDDGSTANCQATVKTVPEVIEEAKRRS